jgi:hypothetical protein
MKPLAKRSTPATFVACAVTATAVMIGAPSVARADDTIKHPGDHPSYSVEAEPHILLGWDNVYAAGGYGIGGRFSIPIVHNGFVDSINNSVAISFGMDITHYEGCTYAGLGCSATYFFFPVAMQWNFFVGQRWSVFGEPGLTIYHGFVDDCAPNNPNCVRPHVNGAVPAFWIGGRYHLSETVSLTLRIGWPAFTFGVSFFP